MNRFSRLFFLSRPIEFSPLSSLYLTHNYSTHAEQDIDRNKYQISLSLYFSLCLSLSLSLSLSLWEIVVLPPSLIASQYFIPKQQPQQQLQNRELATRHYRGAYWWLPCLSGEFKTRKKLPSSAQSACTMLSAHGRQNQSLASPFACSLSFSSCDRDTQVLSKNYGPCLRSTIDFGVFRCLTQAAVGFATRLRDGQCCKTWALVIGLHLRGQNSRVTARGEKYINGTFDYILCCLMYCVKPEFQQRRRQQQKCCFLYGDTGEMKVLKTSKITCL